MKALDYFKQEHLDSIPLIFTGSMTTITAVFGGWDTAFQVFVTCVVIDILTGILKGLTEKDFSSKRMRQGFKTKIGYLFVIILATAFDRIMPADLPVIRTLVLYFYIAVEGSSILENLAQMGVPIPQIVIDRLAVIKGKSGEEAEVDKNGKFKDGQDK